MMGSMEVQGYADAGFAPVRECFEEIIGGQDRVFGHDNAWGLGFGIGDDGYGMGGLGGSYGGTSTACGYSVGFVTGTAGGFDRVDALENALRGCLGLRAVS
jgi:hypothetical protein